MWPFKFLLFWLQPFVPFCQVVMQERTLTAPCVPLFLSFIFASNASVSTELYGSCHCVVFLCDSHTSYEPLGKDTSREEENHELVLLRTRKNEVHFTFCIVNISLVRPASSKQRKVSPIVQIKLQFHECGKPFCFTFIE